MRDDEWKIELPGEVAAAHGKGCYLHSLTYCVISRYLIYRRIMLFYKRRSLLRSFRTFLRAFSIQRRIDKSDSQQPGVGKVYIDAFFAVFLDELSLKPGNLDQRFS
jgi:hypothetical protein